MAEEKNIEAIIVQLGLGWLRFSDKARNFIQIVVTHAKNGDEKKTLEALSAFYSSMDLSKIPGDPSHLFVSACEALASKHLIPQDLVPLGALRGSETTGSRYVVLTTIGLGTTQGSRLYSAETAFDLSEEPSEPSPTGGPTLLGKFAAAAASALGGKTATFVARDPQWEITFTVEPEKHDYARRLATRLTAAVADTWSQPAGSASNLVGDLREAQELFDTGVLTASEFSAVKAKLLGG